MIKILKKVIIYIKCRKLGISWKDYYINNKGEVDIDKPVILHSIKKLPFNFGTINGHFTCVYSNIEPLNYLPKEVIGICDLRNNNLTSFNTLPKSRKILVDGNSIKTFEGFKTFNDVNHIDLLNDFDAIRDNEIILVGFKIFYHI